MSTRWPERVAPVGVKGALLGVVVSAFGLLVTVLVLARGGGYFVVVPRQATYFRSRCWPP